jgi:predicted ATP-dependent endonuclease of OLD family
MRLIAFSVQGYRRFVEPTSVKVHGDLVAFVGPNEAGKSSLLKALSHLSEEGGFAATERPRRSSHSPELTWHLQLDDEDKAAVAGIRDSERVERVAVIKRSDGRRWRLEPHSPKRDRSLRAAAVSELAALRDHEALPGASEDDGLEFSLAEYDSAIEILEADVENYTGDQISVLREAARKLRDVDLRTDLNEEDLPETAAAERRDEWVRVRDAAATALDSASSTEAEPSPFRRCVEVLSPLLPRLVLFGEEDRRLESRYDLNEVATAPPAALMHLADLAELDLPALRDEVASDATADVATRRNAANRILLDAFDQSWNQQGIAIQFEVQGNILIIHATTPDDHGLSNLEERSDGLRWFAALLAFSHGWAEDTILLVDEIEQHLHYDAQADLVDVLTRQSFTSKVIYTTHSFGCLPHDLGTGVRVVHPIDAATSRLENGFWTKGSGFSPLLASMGAAAVSFTPTRHALIGEGPCEPILLPTILRQACDVDRLGFQVAPGLSIVAAAAIPSLDAEAGRVAFVTDGDQGGRDLRRMLNSRGVEDRRIVQLLDDDEELEVEDLVDADVYCAAVNDEIRCWQDQHDEIIPADLTSGLRTKAVDAWCELNGLVSPEKVAVAQRVANLASDGSIFSVRRHAMIQALFLRILEALELGAPR